MSNHTITMEVEIADPASPDGDILEIAVEIDFSYSRGHPPSYDPARGGPGGWDPPIDPEVEPTAFRVIDAPHGIPEANIIAAAERWFASARGFEAAVEEARGW